MIENLLYYARSSEAHAHMQENKIKNFTFPPLLLLLFRKEIIDDLE